MAYQIISDGSCDLEPEITKEKNITIVPFYVSFDDETYEKEVVEIGIRDFYNQMVERKGVYPKSSMPSVQDYLDAFTPIVEQGDSIICICITKKFSGSSQSARTAREMLLETHPQAQIEVIDSTLNTVCQGIYVLEAVRLRDEQVPYEEAIERLKAARSSGRIFFTVGSADYLKHGGRIGKVGSAAVSVLGIRPLITMKEGEIFASGIVKGRKKSMEKVLRLLEEYLIEERAKIEDYSVVVGYGYDVEEAENFRIRVEEFITERFGKTSVPKFQIGATVSVHTGPYPLGVAVVKRP